MSVSHPLTLGAVAYDQKVVTIWDGFQQYFHSRGLDFDYVLYTNYERLVQAQILVQIDVAWNSPLAWLQADRAARSIGRRAEAICMRDSDRDLTSIIVVRSDSRIESLADLRGKNVAVGAGDSPQATLIPLNFLADNGLVPREDFAVIPFDKLLGKHGDHIGGERDAIAALLSGVAHAACILDANLLTFGREGTLPSGSTRVLAQTPTYDHCNFTILDGAPAEPVARFRELLLGMSYSDPAVRPLLDLEGLKRWLPGRTEGYGQLTAAVDRFDTIGGFVRQLAGQWR
ncbi:MAG TPA: PhnD/SsuA/transferrin family substrate-binding protein [Vicinamibacterales bacterium]|jgi:ABC-type phosphate/phosphonate transport system substrate-binding protein|nr:PhnD/SsuA/transferrin family substrate-binding protein [Vicinamibacterales bacterium]